MKSFGNDRLTSSERGTQPLWYSKKFISYENLHKVTPTCQYLKDGRIFLEVDYKLQ